MQFNSRIPSDLCRLAPCGRLPAIACSAFSTDASMPCLILSSNSGGKQSAISAGRRRYGDKRSSPTRSGITTSCLARTASQNFVVELPGSGLRMMAAHRENDARCLSSVRHIACGRAFHHAVRSVSRRKRTAELRILPLRRDAALNEGPEG